MTTLAYLIIAHKYRSTEVTEITIVTYYLLLYQEWNYYKTGVSVMMVE